jgi:hypothetical protein
MSTVPTQAPPRQAAKAVGAPTVDHPPSVSGRGGAEGTELRVAGGLILQNPTHPPGLVVTGHIRPRKADVAQILAVLGARFPARAEVADVAALVRESAWQGGQLAQIDFSPGSVRFRNVVPIERDDKDGDDGDGEPGTKTAITEWTAKSRRQMLRRFASLDYTPLFASGRAPAEIGLTYPDDWLTVAPDGAAVMRHFNILQRRFARAWGMPLACLWKEEFQRRGAPHLHLLAGQPDGLAGQGRDAGKTQVKLGIEFSDSAAPSSAKLMQTLRPRKRLAYADGLPFREWLMATWADIVNHPDPVQKARHRLRGAHINVRDALKATDPKRASVYFSKHAGVKGEKEYQNQVPEEWAVAGIGPGRFWGYTGLAPAVEPAVVGREDYDVAKRTMRRWSVAARTWDQDALTVRYVKATRPVRVRRGKRWRTVRRPVGRLGGRSGTLCVNDGPKMARYLAQVMVIARQEDTLMSKQELANVRQLAADDDVVSLLTDTLGAVAVEQCEYPRCKQEGARYRNGVWCVDHVAKMEVCRS